MSGRRERPAAEWPRGGRRGGIPTLAAVLVSVGLGAGAIGQELTPRAYSPNPTGGNILQVSYGRSSGELLFDPALPFEDVNAGINAGTLVYGRTFSLLGRSANAVAGLPYVWGSLEGRVDGQFLRVTRSGLGDARAQLTLNLLGGPALAPRDFAARRPSTVLGVSLAVAAPTGQYDPAKLITACCWRGGRGRRRADARLRSHDSQDSQALSRIFVAVLDSNATRVPGGLLLSRAASRRRDQTRRIMKHETHPVEQSADRRTAVWGPGLGMPALAAVLTLAGCGGGSGAVSSVDDAKSAVVRIVATGTFQDPEVGLKLNAAGSGTGFIIDPSGIAVTNNHVVTGAATLEVFVGGSAQSVTARVLGVSECADLAVIDLEGDGYPYLEWYPDDIKVNLDVRSAGFPLGDAEYTLTRGIISKARAGGETEWASVDAVIEHDARINPGNSGGPLLDDHARVVGVNYAGRADTGQNFSIAAPLARGIVEKLSQGKDVQAIGINGRAVFDEGAEISGIWVASVESGTPASKAGIKGGDIITRLEGLVLASDGTMKTYCDVLQTKGSDEVIRVEVLRYASQEVLEGELNGTPLAQSFSFADSFGDQVAHRASGGGTADETYYEVTDDSGQLSIQVPTSWAQTNGLSTEAGDPAVSASPDLNAYRSSWGVPGVVFIASRDFAGQTDDAVLDQFTTDECQGTSGRQPYQDALYTGTFEFHSGCGGTSTARMLLVARPSDGGFAAVVDMQLVTDADLAALDQIIATFVVAPGQ